MTSFVPPDEPTALIRRYTFTFATAITTFKILASGTTDSAVNTFLIGTRTFVAYAT